MALINILIPAFKSTFLRQAIESAAIQSQGNVSIVVSDDSRHGEATRDVRNLNCSAPIRFVEGPRKGTHRNMMHLLNQLEPDCRYVHFLFDDDVIFPGFMDTHVVALEASKTARVSVSARWAIDERHFICGDFPVPDQVRSYSGKATAIDINFLFRSTVPFNFNWLGEYSNAVWRRDHAESLREMAFADISYYGLGDVAQLLLAARGTPIVYLTEHLGAFRVHAQQQTSNRDAPALKAGYLAWAALAHIGAELGLLNETEIEQCLRLVLQKVKAIYPGDAEMLAIADTLTTGTIHDRLTSFNAAWRRFSEKTLKPLMQ
ncbi:MAG: glycosyltransferase family 2 protein [Gammaproteobacteria bacterium]|nr:glycosyltransferase family 2 protein [Gammaproteobacteria bacterium]